MLRCIPEAERVAQLLGRALAAATEAPVQPLELPADQPIGAERPAAAMV
jgi:hypothetical protein